MPHMPKPGPTDSWAEVGRGHSDSRYGFEETASQDGAADRCTQFLGPQAVSARFEIRDIRRVMKAA